MGTSNTIKVLNTRHRFKERRRILLETLVSQYKMTGEKLRILEAGCGKRWGLASEEIKYDLIGVDISREALEIRQKLENDLESYFVGDLREIKFENETFDVIYSNFVLEHIQGAERVLENFKDWLTPGGIMIIQVPDNNSTAVFATRIIPHYFHVLFYRYVNKFENAGKPGHGPFKAYYDDVLSIEGFRAFASKQNCSVVVERGIMSPYKGFGFFSLIIHYLSFKRLSHKHNGLLYVLRKD